MSNFGRSWKDEQGKLNIRGQVAERGKMAETEAGKVMVGKCVIVLLILSPILTQLIHYFPISLKTDRES